MSIETSVLTLVEKPILSLGYTKVYVSYKREQGTNILRVTIDKDDVVSLDDIVKVNDLISPMLDEADLIKGEYMLDVTSLGAEKPIEVEHLDHYIGKYINIHLSNPYKGENILEGTLISVNDGMVTISYKIKTRLVNANIPHKDIDKARLAIKF